MDKVICYIPSKARPDTKTYQLFESAGIGVVHFIEPQDMDIYPDSLNKHDIGENDKGICFVRNYMLAHAKKSGYKYVIICDDDVSHFGRYDGTNNTTDASIWYQVIEHADKLPYELYGINYRQHAWYEKKMYAINSKLVEVAIMIKPERVKWTYRQGFELKEDRDFLMQTVKFGSGVFKFNTYFYDCPNVGTNKGGLYDEYKAKKDYASTIKFSKEYHPFVKPIKKNGRLDAQVDLEAFAKYYGRKVL